MKSYAHVRSSQDKGNMPEQRLRGAVRLALAVEAAHAENEQRVTHVRKLAETNAKHFQHEAA